MIRRAGAALMPLMFAAGVARGQTVRGVVVDGAGNPVSGVVVLLVDTSTTAGAVARALTNDRGEYRLAAHRAGAYRIRTMRIGYRPVLSEPLALRADEVVSRRLTLTGVRLALDTVRVVDRSACRTTGDSGLATFAIWEQVRTALTATLLTSATNGVQVTTVRYLRTVDPSMRRVRDQQARVNTDYVRQPWSALSADSIRRFGYAIKALDDSTTFYAPGLETLASNDFIGDHCFQLRTSNDPKTIGVSFTPARNRRDLPEIAGTLWVDRATAELRSLEYHYVGLRDLPREAADRSGGDMEFARMRDGGWAIAAWDIRMPLLASEMNLGHRDIRLKGLRVSGGVLALARRGDDTLWARPPLVLRGQVVDSTTGRPVPSARVSLRGTPLAAVADSAGRFAIPNMLFGAYTAEVRTPSLDAVGGMVVSDIQFTDTNSTIDLDVWPASAAAPILCGDRTLFSRYPPVGVLTGRVEPVGDTIPPRGVAVAVQWREFELAEHGSLAQTAMHVRTLGATTDERGEFRVCGVPADTRLSVAVMTDGGTTEGDTVRIPAGERFAHIDISADLHAGGSATFSGLVLMESTKLPIANAEVALPERDRYTVSDSTGAFKLANIPAGPQHVRIRRVGYGPVDTTLTFSARRTLDRRVYLARVQTLDSVEVKAEGVVLPGFEDHRKLGLGQFLTRDELEKHKGARLSTLLQNMRSVKIDPGVGNIAWLTTGRGAKTIDTRGSSVIHVPDKTEVALGATKDCYAQVYVNGHLVYGRSASDPLFDLNSLQPNQIQAIEYYAGPSETPPEYAGLNSTCGVLVIWLRR